MNENPSNTHYQYGVVQFLPAKPWNAWNEQFYEQFKTDGSVMWKKERILKQFSTVQSIWAYRRIEPVKEDQMAADCFLAFYLTLLEISSNKKFVGKAQQRFMSPLCYNND